MEQESSTNGADAMQRAHLFSADREVVVLNAHELLSVPDQVPGSEVVVGRLFE